MPELPLGAVIAFDFDKWDVDEEIAVVRSIGIRLVQVYRNYVRRSGPEHVRRVLTDGGLEPESLHAYIDLEMLDGPAFDLSAKDDAARSAALEIARGEAEYALVLGCRDIIVHPVGPGATAADPFRPDALARSAERLARTAQETGVRFLLENMPPEMFGSDARLLRRIVDEVDCPHLGLAYDVGHANLARDPVGILRTMGNRLGGVHLHDNDGSDDGHYLPGMGTVPFEDVARTLHEIGFGGTFMLEVYRDTAEVRRDLTPERTAYIEHLRRVASGLTP